MSFTVRTRGSVIRFRSSLWELCVLIVAVAVGVYLAYRYDFFRTPAGVPVARTIQPDEALLLGALLLLGAAVIVMRWRASRQRDADLELTTEEYVRTPSFQKALQRYVIRQPLEGPKPEPRVDVETK